MTLMSFTIFFEFIYILNTIAKEPPLEPFRPISLFKSATSIFHENFFKWIPKNERKNYTITEEVFETKGGWHLTTFRINKTKNEEDLNKPRKVIILCHGYSGSSDDWFQNTNGTGYYFVNRGFDVWVTNI